MAYAHDRLQFTPKPATGMASAIVLALFIHALLLGALSLGVQWNDKPPVVIVQAELWSAVPDIAPPLPAEPVNVPPPAAPPPEPEKTVVPPKTATKPDIPDPQIVQEKLRKEKLEKDNLEKERLAKEKLEKSKLAQLDLEKLEKLRKEKEQKDKELKEKQQQEKLAQEKALKEKEAKDEAEAEAKQMEEIRQLNLKRIAGMAGGSGTKSSGPSAEYAGRIRARIKPNITYTDTISGNPTAEVEVRTSSDGTIISRKITKSSGVKSWDEAVLGAIDKTEVLPRDVDGKVPSSLVISFRPRD